MTILGLDIPLAVIVSLVAALVASSGLVVVAWNDEWAAKNRAYFAAFAAGVLVTTALFLLPDAMGVNRWTPSIVLAGYLGLYGTTILFKRSVGAIAPMLAIGVHSMIDGLEYSVLFDFDVQVGAIASIGLVAHEFAESVILYTVLRAAGLRATSALFGAFLGAAATTPIGAVLSQPILHGLSPEGFGFLLAAAAGALLYVGATHLPTHLNDGAPLWVGIWYAVGVSLAAGLSLFGAHGGHDHGVLIEQAPDDHVLDGGHDDRHDH